MVLDLKYAFHSLRLSGEAKSTAVYYHISEVHLTYIKECHGIKYLPLNLAIIYKCNFRMFRKQKHCKVIMDDLLLFTPIKKLHMAKLEDLLKALLKNRLKISPKSVNYLKQNYNIWEIVYL